jgi:hypothetical protein
MILVDVASTTSSMVAAPQPQGVVVSVGEGTSSVAIDAYAVLTDTVNAVSGANHTTVSAELLRDSADGTSSVVLIFNQSAGSDASATDRIVVADAAQLLISAVQAASSIIGAGTVGGAFVDSKGVGKSFASYSLLEAVTSSANATDLIAVAQRRTDATLTSTADSTSSAYPSGETETYLLFSTADGTSSMQVQNDAVLFISSSADAASDVWFEDPSSKAWVMNTETTAMGWYDNFKFESIVSWRGRELAVGPDGIHELTGDSDNGRMIDSLVESGFTDFGVPQTKRLDNMYFGYTSNGQIAVKPEVYESRRLPYVYFLEERDADAPRNSRVTPGKGLWGRYWRLTITNVDGADFEVHDATVDIAVSTRRI